MSFAYICYILAAASGRTRGLSARNIFRLLIRGSQYHSMVFKKLQSQAVFQNTSLVRQLFEQRCMTAQYLRECRFLLTNTWLREGETAEEPAAGVDQTTFRTFD
jgi:hypothetical protein